MTQFVFNDSLCCTNPDVRTVYATTHYRVVVRTAYLNGHWYDGGDFEQRVGDVGGFCWSPCALPNRPRHASKEAAERHAISKMLDGVDHNEYSAELVRVLRREVESRQLSFF